MTKILEFITELFGWIQIVFFPSLIGLVVGAIVFYYMPDNVGLTIGIVIAIVGLVVGVIFATRIWKKRGTVSFVSRISATPELDNLDKEK